MSRSDFRKNGYVVLEDALTADDLETLRAVCSDLLSEPVDDGGTQGRHKIGLGAARRFLAHRHNDFPALKEIILGPRMAAIANDLLGAQPHLFNEQFVVKGAKTGASFSWHQDGAYVGFDHRPYITVWIALDDATLENGCIRILPRDLDQQPGLDPHEWLEDSNELNGYSGKDPGEALPCKAGTIVVFSSLTLHTSGANTTDAQRRAYICQYSPEPIIDPSTEQPKRFATPLAVPA